MKRKINRVGTGTLTVSLPSKWVKQHNLKAGDELEVDEDVSALIFSAHGVNTGKEFSMTLPKVGDYSMRLLLSPYIAGFDTMRVSFPDKHVLQKIHDTLIYMIGFEILELTEKSCVIQNISRGAVQDPDKVFNRCILLMRTMLKQMATFVRTNDDADKKQIDLYELDMNRLTLYLKRIVSTSKTKTFGKTLQPQVIVAFYEMMGDYVYYLKQAITKQPSEHIATYFDECVQFLELLVNLSKDNPHEYAVFGKQTREFVHRIEKDATEMDSTNALYCHYVLGVITCMRHIGEDMGY